MNDFESWLADELKARASGVEGSASMASAARKQARSIRTRRMVTGGAIAAVIAAVAIPTAMSLTGNPLSGPDPAATTTPITESPTATEPPTEEPTTPPSDPSTEPETPPTETDEPERGGTTELTLDDLPEGNAPAIGWTDGRTFYSPTGGEIPLPEGFYSAVALGDGVAGTMGRDDGGEDVMFLDSAGEQITHYDGHGPIVSGDGSTIAWSDTAGALLFTSADDGDPNNPESLVIENGDILEPVGFAAPDVVVSNITSLESESLGWRIDHLRGESVDWNVETIQLESASAVSQAAGLIAGVTESNDEGGCSAVFDGPTGEELWNTCEHRVYQFSPDGRYALGSHAYGDGPGDAFAVVFDARTGEIVHTFDTAENDVLPNSAFEDDSHVLIVLNTEYGSGGTSKAAILRCTLDGACETATDVRELGDDEFPFGFGVQP